VSGRRRLAFAATGAGVALLVAFVVARHGGVDSLPPGTDSGRVPAPGLPSAAPAIAGTSPPSPPPSTSPTDPPAPALTPVGASRAMAAISKNEQTRRLFLRLQSVDLSPQQRDRVLLILGTAALHPSEESPTLKAMRADGGSRVLSDDEAKRVRAERQQIEDRMMRDLRPALATVLTPVQLARAGLGGGSAAASTEQNRR